ncbi:adenylate/guanylate cyclase domain-containing protein [Parachitinimonas caeni]|uniref:Adenylate/guanylate cyclase domain-containing protein n=1 Tax=Parachitinimonas caeni TaxID=3031301 RepID=A0ABT7DZL2_9NEIS|nr:adenylate/guanylate cyclase domain-containing protein [Parachitinimonas caeni]MDK2124092.1 adenylate/guanylate cyclase domain-containing protein [Parachitinimonas caeni]
MNERKRRALLSPTIERLLQQHNPSIDEGYRRVWETEAKRNANFLRNILPDRIASRLKTPDSIVAEGHPDVSILFADIVNFTHLSGELTPQAVVEMLDGFFTPIDLLCERHSLEKIKTVGDAYMLAGGLETDPAFTHTQRVLDAAFDIITLAQQHPPVAGAPFGVRVGIATGPIIAGVIGRKKVTYDLWGDTVNIASRMCSEAEPMQIAMDELTYLSLSDQIGQLTAEQVEIRGKGSMKIYRISPPSSPGSIATG